MRHSSYTGLYWRKQRPPPTPRTDPVIISQSSNRLQLITINADTWVMKLKLTRFIPDNIELVNTTAKRVIVDGTANKPDIN